ncbi:hypothetical protein [Telluribacter sp. SYSU D00476]|uniref:hypothetical protein n=1 Tax=Telluribacter sp. SYSU D00476 TaxID=2811430 RepID=UPI001FF11A60|nr:hypothetical protein [Telluribacter sp. SYSU D00476]
MKRLICIGSIFLLLLNTLGYYPVYMCMQLKAQLEMQHKLDQNILGEEELFTIKIPIQLPYWTETRQAPERINGQIEYHNEFYKLYKQEVVGDTLVVLCVKDHTEKQLFQTLTEWVKITVTGLPGTSEKASQLVSYLIKDYYSSHRKVYFNLYDWIEAPASYASRTFSLTPAALELHSPPPEAIA